MYVYQVHERDRGNMTDGSRIRELRTRRGLLQRELIEMAGVTESAVRNYELGLRAPRPQHLEAPARALGVDSAAPGAQKLDAAVRAWAAMRARRDSGEISEEEYLVWKRSAAHC